MPSIAFRDFGPIAHAEVDLKPLTVLIGSNNTGKSYLALAIYALSQAVSGTRHYGFGPLRSTGWPTAVPMNRNSVQRWNKLVGDSLTRTPDFARVLSGQVELRELPAKVREWLRNESEARARDLSRDVGYQMRRCFGSTLSQLGRRSNDPDCGYFEASVRDETTGLAWDLRSQDDDLVTAEWKPDFSQATTTLSQSRFPISGLDDPEFLVPRLASAYSEFLLRSYIDPAHYLPASRSGILQGHKTLATLIVGRASTAWIESMEVERLPGVITDLVQALLVLERRRPATGKIRAIVEYLESNVVGGSVDIAKQMEYPELKYQNEAGDFHLHQVSSTISEIAPMVLYLKYLVRSGHLFILEEPESHLDPTNQRFLARAIAMLVNAGVRVLVTTHSDIVLGQINNLMQVSGFQARRRPRMGYKSAEVLSPSDVSAYVFQPSADGSRVHRLSVDSEEGISTESFDSVHRALYDESIRMEHAR